MSSEKNQENTENQENSQEIPEIPENKSEDCTDTAPLVPKRSRGRPKGSRNKVKILTVDTDIPSETLHEEPVAPLKKPRAKRTTRVQSPPLDPTPEMSACSGTTMSPMATMMMSLHEMQQQRMAARKTMFRNMIA